MSNMCCSIVLSTWQLTIPNQTNLNTWFVSNTVHCISKLRGVTGVIPLVQFLPLILLFQTEKKFLLELSFWNYHLSCSIKWFDMNWCQQFKAITGQTLHKRAEPRACSIKHYESVIYEKITNFIVSWTVSFKREQLLYDNEMV